MRLRSLLLAPAVTLGITAGLVAVAPGAFPHTPTHKAACEGLELHARAYDSRATNTWTMILNGVTQTGTFGSTFDKTLPVPQDGATSTYRVMIDAPGTAYDYDKSGSIGPCGTPPPPPPPPVQPPPPVVPPTPPAPPVVPPAPPKHARAYFKVTDHCNCYRDNAQALFDPHKMSVKVKHPRKTLWVFTITAKPGYLVASTVDGHGPWVDKVKIRVKTTNVACPCHKRGNCPEGYHPPSTPCRDEHSC